MHLANDHSKRERVKSWAACSGKKVNAEAKKSKLKIGETGRLGPPAGG